MSLRTDLPRSADVVIIGGGFAGLSTASALADRRITDVVVLEGEASLGKFASGRAAGLGRQLVEDDETTALTVRGAHLLRSQWSAAWSPTGGILTFDNREHAQGYIERAARFGVRVSELPRETVLAHWPALDTLELEVALHVPSDGVIDVARLLELFAARGEIALDTRATAIIPMPGGARIETSRGDIVARAVVDATGAWAGHIVGDPPLPSYRRHIFTLAAPAGDAAPFVWHLGARELYVRSSGSETMTSPCDATLAAAGDQQPDAEGEQLLRRAFAGSQLESAAIARAWACQRTFTPAGTMRLGRDPSRPWLVHAVGLGGHGATAAPAVGETVAAAVAQIV